MSLMTHHVCLYVCVRACVIVNLDVNSSFFSYFLRSIQSIYSFIYEENHSLYLSSKSQVLWPFRTCILSSFYAFVFNIASSGMIERGKGRCVVIFSYNDSLAFS